MWVKIFKCSQLAHLDMFSQTHSVHLSPPACPVETNISFGLYMKDRVVFSKWYLL